MAITVFKRYEKKYMLTLEQYADICEFLKDYMNYDDYCQNDNSYHLYNMYFDSPDNILIRTSVDGPIYKEKLRMRSYYGLRGPDDKVFFEIKQKYNGIVTKRRSVMRYAQAMEMVKTRQLPDIPNVKYFDRQVQKEIIRMLNYYDLQPSVYISYNRIALFGKDNPELRITFDNEIYTRRENVNFDGDTSGTNILPPDKMLMEIKIPNAMPLWLADYLCNHGIYNSSFSKYGKEYENYMVAEKQPILEVKNA